MKFNITVRVHENEHPAAYAEIAGNPAGISSDEADTGIWINAFEERESRVESLKAALRTLADRLDECPELVGE